MGFIALAFRWKGYHHYKSSEISSFINLVCSKFHMMLLKFVPISHKPVIHFFLMPERKSSGSIYLMNNNHSTNNRTMSNVLCLSYAVLGGVSLLRSTYISHRTSFYEELQDGDNPKHWKPQTERGIRQVCLFTPNLFNTYGKTIPP